MAYSMPQGDKRGTSYEFYDWNYDGEWTGNQLKNGLGCLTDGDFGPDNFKMSYYAPSKTLLVRLYITYPHNSSPLKTT